MRFWRCYKVMKYLWFIDIFDDIWKFPEDYSYWTKYLKIDNYITNYLRKTTKKGFNDYKRFYKLKEISEADVFLEML